MEQPTLEGIKLYSYFRSSSAHRVRMALNLKKITYEILTVNLLKKEQSEGSYKDMNPSGLLPALIIDGHLLSESLAILEYLEETRGDNIPLMPKDPIARAHIRALMEHVNSGIQPLQNLRTINKIGDDYNGDKIAWCVYWNTVGLTSLEKIIAEKAGKYSYGDEPTLADCVIYPQLTGAFKR
jgi:maleylacetoacetate isomerase